MDDSERPARHGGNGTCYVEFGDEVVARLDADFFGGPSRVAPLTGPDLQTSQEKKDFARDRRRRWFGHAE